MSTNHFIEKDIPQIKSAFKAYDRDRTGCLSVENVAEVLALLGIVPDRPRIRDLMDTLDTNGNGLIEEEEFVRYILSRSKDDFGKDMFSALLSAFEWFDLDRNGFIDKNEMRQILGKLGNRMSEDEIDKFFSLLDENKDGQISIEEMLNGFQSKVLAVTKPVAKKSSSSRNSNKN